MLGGNERDVGRNTNQERRRNNFAQPWPVLFSVVSNRIKLEDITVYLCIITVGPVEHQRANSEELCHFVSFVPLGYSAILALDRQALAWLFY